jgi:hypothetical protein
LDWMRFQPTFSLANRSPRNRLSKTTDMSYEESGA